MPELFRSSARHAVLEQFEIVVKWFGWILFEGMKRGKENAVAHRSELHVARLQRFRLAHVLTQSLEVIVK